MTPGDDHRERSSLSIEYVKEVSRCEPDAGDQDNRSDLKSSRVIDEKEIGRGWIGDE